MKVRAGFVSNSSSSSFIISTPKGFELTFENLAKFMFPNDPELTGGFGLRGDNGISAQEAVKITLKDLQEAGIANDELLAESLHRLDHVPSYLAEFIATKPQFDYDKARENPHDYWAAHGELEAAWSAKVVAAMKANNTETDTYVIEYSDDYTIGAAMEHGGVFDELINSNKAICISNH